MKSLRSRLHLVRMVSVLLLTLIFSAGMSTPASAALEYNEQIQFTDDFDSCSGERILVNGTQHIVGRFIKDGTGKLHFGFTRNTYGAGTGQISGEAYILTDAVTRTSFEIMPGEPRIFMQQYHARLMRQGEAVSDDDTLIHFLSHITVNANGDVTTSIEVQNVECQ